MVNGRNNPHFVDERIGAWLDHADIVVNPTHDRMGNGGTLKAKRKFLSSRGAGGRSRLYISVSNWNGEPLGKKGKRAKPRQSPNARTLHTAVSEWSKANSQDAHYRSRQEV